VLRESTRWLIFSTSYRSELQPTIETANIVQNICAKVLWISVSTHPGFKDVSRIRKNRIIAAAMEAVAVDRQDSSAGKKMNWQAWHAVLEWAGNTDRVTAGLE